MCDLTNPIFTDENAARAYLEGVRWDKKPICPHCGEIEKIKPLEGKKHRPGLYQCNSCRQQFTVTVGTLYERYKVPLHKWLLATHLLSASKKGISTHQLHRMLGVTYKTAWFMTHRIREAMKDDDPSPMGGSGQAVEADETYLGGKKRGKNPKGLQHGQADKMKVVSLVERGGRAHSFHVASINSKGIRDILVSNVDRKTNLMTDEASHYLGVGREYKSHQTVHHTIKEYVSGNAHTNTIEGFFSIFKRGMKGVYQHCGKQHLKRYLSEFDFRYNTRKLTDAERRDIALQGIAGKRLTYRRAGCWANI
mgnify:CR=1 FL=1